MFLERPPNRNPQAAIAELGPPRRPQIAKSQTTRPLSESRVSQQTPHVRKILRPQFQGREWLRQVYGRLGFFPFFCWETSMPMKFLVLGAGGLFGFFGGVGGGGWSANSIFMGVGIFLNFTNN